MPRPDGRRPDELRSVKITRRYLKYAEGSVLIELGDTRVVCAASIEERVPPWLRGAGQGWITAEYGMIPRATQERNPRDAGRPGGRVQEIQRRGGRSLRAAVDLAEAGERTAEGLPFTRDEMLQLLGLAEAGIHRLVTFQRDALADIASVARR